MKPTNSISLETSEGPFSTSAVWESERDGAFRDWLIASFSPSSGGQAGTCNGDSYQALRLRLRSVVQRAQNFYRMVFRLVKAILKAF